MTNTFDALKRAIENSEHTKRDMKKIEDLIKDSIMEEVQKQLDDFLIDRCFIQLNQE